MFQFIKIERKSNVNDLFLDSSRDCDNGRMIKMKADWIQNDGYKDVTVTLKVLKFEDDFPVCLQAIHPIIVKSN